MRHIQISTLLVQFFSDTDGKKARTKLWRAHKKAVKIAPADRQEYARRNGPNKWKVVKDRLINTLGTKCWYTEVEITGAPLAVDHYRPISDYWWLTYDPENYRIACPWANSPEHNASHGCAGGKGDNFPLLPPGLRATGKRRLKVEKPVILDPCCPDDCELLVFQADGRPILNPRFQSDAIAAHRVAESSLLLNLDHPDFNSKREQLCNDIRIDVESIEALLVGSVERVQLQNRLATRLASTAPFTRAARCYLSLHRHLDWVQQILDTA